MIHSRSAVVRAAKLHYKFKGVHAEYKAANVHEDEKVVEEFKHNDFYAEKDDDILFPWDMEFRESLVERIRSRLVQAGMKAWYGVGVA